MVGVFVSEFEKRGCMVFVGLVIGCSEITVGVDDVELLLGLIDGAIEGVETGPR